MKITEQITDGQPQSNQSHASDTLWLAVSEASETDWRCASSTTQVAIVGPTHSPSPTGTRRVTPINARKRAVARREADTQSVNMAWALLAVGAVTVLVAIGLNGRPQTTWKKDRLSASNNRAIAGVAHVCRGQREATNLPTHTAKREDAPVLSQANRFHVARVEDTTRPVRAPSTEDTTTPSVQVLESKKPQTSATESANPVTVVFSRPAWNTPKATCAWTTTLASDLQKPASRLDLQALGQVVKKVEANLEGVDQKPACKSMMGWQVSRGNWSVKSEGTLVGTPNAGLTLVSLKREVGRFSRLEVEVRGKGDVVGFSFGKGQRFLARPIDSWQKLTLVVVEGQRLELRVDGDVRESLELPRNTQADQLPDVVYLRGMGTRIEFRNFVEVK